MLVKQTAIYFFVNVFSAAFGFLNVVVFTRIFEPNAYGDYLLGLAFATLFATLLATPLKFLISERTVARRRNRCEPNNSGSADAVLACRAAWLPCGANRQFAAGGRRVRRHIRSSNRSVRHKSGNASGAAERDRLHARNDSAHDPRIRAGTWRRFFWKRRRHFACVVVDRLLPFDLSFWRRAWGNSTPRFDVREFLVVAKTGAPLTLSLSLLAFAGVTDRFLLAKLSGSAAAGDFGASFDLVRQALIIPAVSVASAFVPMTVQIFATRGGEAARCHLEKCLEILLAICLPACVGYALVSGQIADFALGRDFRQTAHEAMPYLAIGVVFQILNQQYMHTSFLLSKRNTFYLINSGSILLFNVIVSALLIPRFGVMGAVWGRVGTEAFGFFGSLILSRSAFAMPFPLDRILRVVAAVGAMALVVRLLATSASDQGPTLLFAQIPAGIVVYATAAWLLDIGGLRAGLRGSPARALAPWRGFAVRLTLLAASLWSFTPMRPGRALDMLIDHEDLRFRAVRAAPEYPERAERESKSDLLFFAIQMRHLRLGVTGAGRRSLGKRLLQSGKIVPGQCERESAKRTRRVDHGGERR